MKARANTETQVRALVWEEARVGGAIAAVSLIVSLLMLGQLFRVYGRTAWAGDEFMANFATLGIPLFVGLLIILNPDTSGHLVGGFSKRILRLPVRTPIAVAVSLLVRTAIVFAVALMIVGIANLLFDRAPALSAICLITFVYLVAQTIDWLRGPLRGLSSVVVLLGILFGALWIWSGAPISKPLREFFDAAERAPFVLPAVLAVALLGAYPINAFAVRADRIGRRYGIPEIWEWPALISPSRRRVNMRPFRSPMAAQVWFELRRTKFLLPLVTLLMTVIIYSGVMIANDRDVTNTASAVVLAFFSFYGLSMSLLLGAAVQGIQSRVVGFRRHSRMTGYEYLQPLTDAQFATARVIAAAVLLVPTLIAALAIHFGLVGRLFVTEMIPTAMERGMTSPREAVWMLISRGLFAGLLAWAAFAIGTRLFRRILAVLLAIYGVLVFLDLAPSRYFSLYIINLGWPQDMDKVTSLVATLFMVAMITSAVVLTRRGVLSVRTLVKWIVAWLLLGWLFHGVLVSMWIPSLAPVGQQLLAVLTALGTASLLPLVYFAILFDVHRRRAGDTTVVDPAQHAATPFRVGPGFVAAMLGAGFVLWLGWPAEPAYMKYRRAHGYPATRKELDAWYVTPPADQNVALKYAAIFPQLEKLGRDFDDSYHQMSSTMVGGGRHRAFVPDSGANGSTQLVYLIGRNAPKRTGLLDRQQWNMTNFYWSVVSSKIVPQLEEIAKQDTSISRYPVDLSKGYDTMLEHLTPLRELNRHVSVDALHWTIAGKPNRAVDSILAGYAIPRSLQKEPLIISQLVGIALIPMNTDAVEFLLNRSVPAEADLARLQRGIEGVVPPMSQNLLLDRAIIGEVGIQASMAPFWGDIYTRVPNATPRALLPLLVYPLASSRMAFTLEMDNTLRDSRLPWADFQRITDAREDSEAYRNALSLASPMVGMLMPAITRAYESEFRNRAVLQNARVAIAVERYRLANKKLPDTLDALVPEFLTEVPQDLFADPGVPVKYLVRADGEYVIYSIGVDLEDDFGLYDKKRGYRASDITFTVAPMSVRIGRQVATYYDVLPPED